MPMNREELIQEIMGSLLSEAKAKKKPEPSDKFRAFMKKHKKALATTGAVAAGVGTGLAVRKGYKSYKGRTSKSPSVIKNPKFRKWAKDKGFAAVQAKERQQRRRNRTINIPGAKRVN